MFESLVPLEPDPILGLMAAYRADPNTKKVDLGVGVYKDEMGNTPVLESVKAAEAALLQRQTSKAYISPMGSDEFNHQIATLLLGLGHPALVERRAAVLQTPGGCGALRAGAELIVRARPEARIWVSDPTWANHIPLLGSAGVEIKTYPYYDCRNKTLRFDAMLDSLGQARAGDVVLLHGCCHNPCGSDLRPEQWRVLTELVVRIGLVPFVDVAYQGFGLGLELDVEGLRMMAAAAPELLIASSCSKNFGLYRERTGALVVVAPGAEQAKIVGSQTAAAVRSLWSMPPDHGAAVVGAILSDRDLRTAWESELAVMRNRINGLREQLVMALSAAGAGDFGFIAQERGMFSFLGLSPVQVARLRSEYSIYLVDSSRINVAGLSHANLDYVCDAVRAVCS